MWGHWGEDGGEAMVQSNSLSVIKLRAGRFLGSLPYYAAAAVLQHSKSRFQLGDPNITKPESQLMPFCGSKSNIFLLQFRHTKTVKQRTIFWTKIPRNSNFKKDQTMQILEIQQEIPTTVSFPSRVKKLWRVEKLRTENFEKSKMKRLNWRGPTFKTGLLGSEIER